MNTQMYFIMLHATPKGDNPESETCGGAYINYWVLARNLDEAIARASERVAAEGWDADEVVEAKESRRENYDAADPDSGLECFEEAAVEGDCVLLYTYPIEDEE